MPGRTEDRPMSYFVLMRCKACGADLRLDATLVTVVVDLTEDRASIPYVCQLCGAENQTGDLTEATQRILMDVGAGLAVSGW